MKKLWVMREEVANATVNYGYTLKYDVSLPSNAYYSIVEATRELIASSDLPSKDKIITTGYGHIGDGNLHLNVSLDGYKD